MTDRATRQHLLALERRATVQSGLIRDLGQRVERELGGALAAALKRIEALERRLVRDDPKTLDLLDQATVGPAHVHHDRNNGTVNAGEPIRGQTRQYALRRLRKSAPEIHASVPAARAAEVLGCSSNTVRRLVASGALRGDSRRLTGRRRHWSVSTADLERLISKGGAPGAPGTPETPIPGARRSGAKG